MNYKSRVKVRLKKLIVAYLRKFLRQYAPSVLAVSGSTTSASPPTVFSMMRHSIETSRDPVGTVNFVLQSVGLSEKDVWIALNELKGNASPNFKLISNFCHQIQSDDIRLKLIFSRHISSHDMLSANVIDDLIGEYSIVADRLKSAQSTRTMLATLILLKAPLPVVTQKFEQLSFDFFALTESQKIQFLTRLKKNNCKDDFKEWVSRFKFDSAPAKLKVIQMQGDLFGGGREKFDHIEQGFLQLGYDVSDRFDSELKKVFDAIPDERNLTWIQYDKPAIEKFKNSIISRVESKEPLCYIRINDGECYGFADGTYVNEEGVFRQERHWWGTNLSPESRKEIQEGFLASLEKADVLGVPTSTRLVKDFNLVKSDSYPVNSIISRTLCVMKGMEELLNGKTVVEGQSNLFLFDSDFCESLFSKAEKVCVISGVNKELVISWAPDPSKLECIEIPTHRLLREGRIGSSTAGILPEVYKEYLEIVSRIAAPGVVVMVSAGFIGKMFIAEAAKSGAVALDIGQSLVHITKGTS